MGTKTVISLRIKNIISGCVRVGCFEGFDSHGGVQCVMAVR